MRVYAFLQEKLELQLDIIQQHRDTKGNVMMGNITLYGFLLFF